MKMVRLLTGMTAVLPAAVAANAAATALPAAAAIQPNTIVQKACSGGTAHWLHLYTTYHGAVCFGFRGSTHPNLYADKYCPGNNSGSIYWTSPLGASGAEDFGPAIGITGHLSLGSNNHDYVYFLNITSWRGNATC